MGGKHPKVIITDQDPAMKVAIAMVFPNTIHRRCQWHVLRKARDHLGVLYGSKPDFKAELVAVIEYSLTVSNFEKNWKAMVKKYQLEDNSHLKLMFKGSNEWVPAYFREIFTGNMSTSQRSERMNAALKVWVTCNTSLYRFAVQFDKLVEGIYEKESDADINTMNETPLMCSCDPIKAEARKVYTRNVFFIFKEKVRRSTAYQVREIEKDKVYEVRPAIPQIIYEWYNQTRFVYVDRENARADCECKGFQFQELLCPHAIAVMRHVEMELFLPTHYVLKRRMRNANSSVKRPAGVEVNESDLESIMLATLTREMEKVSIKAVKCRPAYDIACTRIRELDAEITTITSLVVPNSNNATISNGASGVRKSLQYHDPPISQCKGKRNPHWLKPPSELRDVKKMRTCGYCHGKEGHNMKTCPKRVACEKGKQGQISDVEADGNEDDASDNNFSE